MNKIIYAFFISIVLATAVTAYSDGIQEDLQTNLVRLHIIANSDADYDQAVKLEVRNAILEKIKNKNKNEITSNLNELEDTANEVLAQNNFDYTAKAVYGKFYFPKKEYKNMTLPAGEYYGVRIILGKGNGHNWWCVMYPPLCVSDDNSVTLDKKSQSVLENNLRPETYDIITKSDKSIVVKFKTVEFIQELKEKLKNH
jgi:stage II sporulation protein R